MEVPFRQGFTRTLSALALLAALAACGGRQAAPSPQAAASPRANLSVTEISLGRAVRPDRRVAEPREAFAPADTVYASVVTEGSAASGRLKARWTRGSDVVAESSLEIAPSGTVVSEFHISKPDGLPRGAYEVEIFLDGASAGKRRFSVE